ncbi:MAG: hypothetical protein IKZ81_00585 [Clostridia bacterium]|nr:hypothetical protein [Clostridia bacterium]
MKRILTAILAAAIIMAFALSATGCSPEGLHLGQASIITTDTTFKPAPESSEESESSIESSEESSEEESSGESETESGEEESESSAPAKPAFEGGSVNVNVVTASIAIDNDNIIKSLKLDKYDLSVAVDENGYLIGEISTDGVKSAKELAYDYGMKASSKLSLEWFEQVANFEKWAVGKTVSELLNMQTVYIDDERATVPNEPDLNVSVSISVGDFLKVIRLAAINAGWDPSSDRLAQSSDEEEEINYSSFFESGSGNGNGEYEDEVTDVSTESEPESETESGSEDSSN